MGWYLLSLCGKGFDSESVDDDLEGKDVDNVFGIFGDLLSGSLYFRAKRLIILRIAIISITILNKNMV